MARLIDNIRAKSPERIKYQTIKTKIYRLNNPLIYKSHTLVNNYYKRNKEEKPKQCSYCESINNIELHHEDYNKPNEVIPLCSMCHSHHHNWTIIINLNHIIIIPF